MGFKVRPNRFALNDNNNLRLQRTLVRSSFNFKFFNLFPLTRPGYSINSRLFHRPNNFRFTDQDFRLQLPKRFSQCKFEKTQLQDSGFPNRQILGSKEKLEMDKDLLDISGEDDEDNWLLKNTPKKTNSSRGKSYLKCSPLQIPRSSRIVPTRPPFSPIGKRFNFSFSIRASF